MAEKLNPKRLALTLGTFAAFVHLVWVVLVAAGLAQWLVDFKLGLHFLSIPYTVVAFNPATAVLLLIVAFVVGYVVGWVLAWLWNWAGKRR